MRNRILLLVLLASIFVNHVSCAESTDENANNYVSIASQAVYVEENDTVRDNRLSASLYISNHEIWFSGTSPEGKPWLICTNDRGEILFAKILEDAPGKRVYVRALSKVEDTLLLGIIDFETQLGTIGVMRDQRLDDISYYPMGDAKITQMVSAKDGMLVLGLSYDMSPNTVALSLSMVGCSGDILFQTTGKPYGIDRDRDEIPTIHEGVAAQALERKGIISDRCEINRQIKADNAMLRELKAEIKKLAALVARTVPAIAEGLEKLRSRVLIYCYQLSHICSGKSHIQKSLAVWKPELERYTGLVQQIKAKSKERKTLVAEKKELPIYHVKRHKALAVRIAELTEDLEELRFEKALLLQKFEYAEDAGAEAFRKDIATMEACLKKLETREQKYSVELDKALTEYAELKAQAADFDPVELYKARQVIRPAQEKAAEQQLEDAMHEKPSLIMLLSAKQETSHLLGADAEERQARQLIMHRNQEQYRNSLSKRKRNDPER